MLYLFLIFAQQYGSQKFLENALSAPSPEAWTRHENSPFPHQAAYVLDEQIQLFIDACDYFIEVRICESEGMDFLTGLAFSAEVKQFQGSIWYPNGDHRILSSQEHLVEKLAYRALEENQKYQVLVPEGLTANCVVRLAWRENRVRGLPERASQLNIEVPRTATILSKKIIISEEFANLGKILYTDGILGTLTKLYWDPRVEGFDYSYYSDGENTILDFKNIPAHWPQPYTIQAWNEKVPRVQIYKTLGLEESNPQLFWESLCEFIRDEYRDIPDLGTVGREWIYDMKTSAPIEKVNRANYIFNQFRKKFIHPDYLPSHQIRPANMRSDTYSADFFATSFQISCADPSTYAYLLFQVFQQLELNPKLVLASPVNRGPFHPTRMSLGSLDFENPIVALEDDTGGRYYYCPSQPAYGPGSLPTALRGTTALYIDPAHHWKPQWFPLNKREASNHALAVQTKFEMAKNQWKRTTQWVAKGEIAAQLKMHFFAKSEDHRRSLLADIWREQLPTWTVVQTAVRGLDTWESNPAWLAQLERPLDSTSKTLILKPFEGNPNWVEEPNWWPPTGKNPSFLPFPTNKSMNR